MVGGEREVERLEARKREKEKKRPHFCLFILKKFVLPSFNLCHRSCTSCHRVQKARLVLKLFFFFFHFCPPPPLPRCLASGTGSEALIWLPVRQQPFNNNAIVPHSSSPVSLIHPAVCRWYIVCGFRKHSPFRDVFPLFLLFPLTHTNTNTHTHRPFVNNI